MFSFALKINLLVRSFFGFSFHCIIEIGERDLWEVMRIAGDGELHWNLKVMKIGFCKNPFLGFLVIKCHNQIEINWWQYQITIPRNFKTLSSATWYPKRQAFFMAVTPARKKRASKFMWCLYFREIELNHFIGQRDSSPSVCSFLARLAFKCPFHVSENVLQLCLGLNSDWFVRVIDPVKRGDRCSMCAQHVRCN